MTGDEFRAKWNPENEATEAQAEDFAQTLVVFVQEAIEQMIGRLQALSIEQIAAMIPPGRDVHPGAVFDAFRVDEFREVIAEVVE